MSSPRAVIIGGSVGGLFAANLLRSIGWDVAVYERSGGDLAERGAGLGATPELFGVLQRLGIALDASIMGHVRSRIFLDASGNIVHEVVRKSATSAWGELYGTLRSRLPPACYRGGTALERFEQATGGIRAFFTDGSIAEGDLLVAADGLFSTVRRQLMPAIQPAYAGYIGWRGIMREDDLPADVRETIVGRLTFGGPDGELVILVPLPGSDAHGRRRLHYTWYRIADEQTTLPDLCTDAQGHCHGVSIAPPLIRQELIDSVLAEAQSSLAPQIATVITRASRPFLQPIWDLASPAIASGRVVLVGDAAFVARPHVATGVSKAALDLQCLVDALAQAGDVDAALGRYREERERVGRHLVARGRHLGAWMRPPHEAAEATYAAGRTERIRTLLEEYGAAGVMRPVAT